VKPSNTKTQSTYAYITAALLLATAILAIDVNLPLGVAGGVPYVAVILISWWVPGHRTVLALAVLCSILTLAGYIYSPPAGTPWVVVANRVLAGFAIWVTATLLIVAKWANAEILRHETEQISTFLQISPDSIVTVNDRGIIQMLSTGAESMFGYKAEELIGSNLKNLIPKRYRQAHSAHPVGFLGTPDTHRRMNKNSDVIGVRKDGTEFPIMSTISKFEIGEDMVFTAMLHDITEQKAAEKVVLMAMERAERATQEKTNFLSNISHELRTPLNAIIGFSNVLSNEIFGPLENPQYREYATDIHNSGEHLLELINRVLDLAKMEAGEMNFTEEPIIVGDVIGECIRMTNGNGVTAKVQYDKEKNGDLPMLNGDRLRIKQILLNLLSNAVKFSPPDMPVTIASTGTDDGGLLISVSDGGPGIAAQDIDKVLHPFGQVANATTKPGEGTGLGLPLAKSLAELHDGTLVIDSIVGEGTTVNVWFPKSRCVVPDSPS